MSIAQKLIIELAGEPRSKERPRLGRHGQVYTPSATVGYERSLGWAAKIARKGRKPLVAWMSFSSENKHLCDALNQNALCIYQIRISLKLGPR
jgi:hypothetical protein